MFADSTCMNLADQLSCQNMLKLAQKEYHQNDDINRYMIEHPVCERFQNLADREQEYVLQKPLQFAKNLCMVKKPTYDQGDYVNQLHALPFDRMQFEEWTRRKFSTNPVSSKAIHTKSEPAYKANRA